MKKIFKVLALSVSVTVLSSLLLGCGIEKAKPAEEKKETKTEKLKIGLSLASLKEERWVRDREKIKSECEKLGVDLEVQVADEDLSKQVSQCETLLTKGIKVLIIAPQDATAAATIVEKAHQANVKVISYDRLILKADVDLYVTFDNEKVGESQAKYLVSKAPKGNYVVLSGDPADNNAKLFKQGAMKVLDPKIKSGDIKVVFEQSCVGWKASEAMKHMENALSTNSNKIDAVLAPNDGTAGGCIQALAAQGLAGKLPISGQDAEVSAVKRIIDGTQSMTVFKDTRKLGAEAVAAAIKFSKGETPTSNAKLDNGKIEVPSQLLDLSVIDKDNYKQELIDTGYIKEADLK